MFLLAFHTYPVTNLPKLMLGPVLCALLSLLTFFSGRADGVTVTQPVAGEVRVKGQPVQGVQVVLTLSRNRLRFTFSPARKPVVTIVLC